jgi:hypothetical protein
MRYRRIHDFGDGILVCAQSGEETGTHGAVDDAERRVASSHQPIEGPVVKGAKPSDKTAPQGHVRREPRTQGQGPSASHAASFQRPAHESGVGTKTRVQPRMRSHAVAMLAAAGQTVVRHHHGPPSTVMAAVGVCGALMVSRLPRGARNTAFTKLKKPSLPVPIRHFPRTTDPSPHGSLLPTMQTRQPPPPAARWLAS